MSLGQSLSIVAIATAVAVYGVFALGAWAIKAIRYKKMVEELLDVVAQHSREFYQDKRFDKVIELTETLTRIRSKL